MADQIEIGKLRSFVERIELLEDACARQRPFFSEKHLLSHFPSNRPDWVMGPRCRISGGYGVSTSDASAILEQCWRLCRVGRAENNEWPEDRRGYTIACRLTGLGWNDVQKALADCNGWRCGGAAALWARHMSPPDTKYIGYVYSAYSPLHSDVVKIGFSTNPAKRMKSLARQHGTEIVLGACLDGTMLHEWALHQIIRKQVAPEWYCAASIPTWLMPPQLKREAA